MDPIIPFASFNTVVRGILSDLSNESGNSYRITKDALDALQESAEDHVVRRLRQSYLLTIARRAETLSCIDMKCVKAVHDDN